MINTSVSLERQMNIVYNSPRR